MNLRMPTLVKQIRHYQSSCPCLRGQSCCDSYTVSPGCSQNRRCWGIPLGPWTKKEIVGYGKTKRAFLVRIFFLPCQSASIPNRMPGPRKSSKVSFHCSVVAAVFFYHSWLCHKKIQVLMIIPDASKLPFKAPSCHTSGEAACEKSQRKRRNLITQNPWTINRNSGIQSRRSAPRTSKLNGKIKGLT